MYGLITDDGLCDKLIKRIAKQCFDKLNQMFISNQMVSLMSKVFLATGINCNTY